jgi:hypothetical protein
MDFRKVLADGLVFVVALQSTAFRQTGFAQGPTATVLEIDGENTVFYVNDITDYAKLASNPGRVAAIMPKNFISYIGISDVVAVNGKPAKGTWVVRANGIFLRPAPASGQAIADTTRNTIVDQVLEILQSDGSSIGTIMSSGFGGLGPPPPGAPSSATASNFAITGGTGAFLGARGEIEFVRLPADAPGVSVTEDPSRRRANGGGSQKLVVHLIPMTTPEILNVWHSDFTPVSAAKPARADEIMIVSARGLGATRPGLDPGQSFPANPLQIVNSPIQITASGQSVEVINQVGWPGEQNLYRLDFRMPKTTGTMAALQLTAAWIAGPTFAIPVQ